MKMNKVLLSTVCGFLVFTAVVRADAAETGTAPATPSIPTAPAPTTPDPTPAPALPTLDERVQKLETTLADLGSRVMSLENTGGPTGWSCTAQCGGFTNSNLDYKIVSGAGRTAGEAFSALQTSCDSNLFNGISYYGANNASRMINPATIQNACVKN